MTQQADHNADDDESREVPWWHSPPGAAGGDSVFVEGLKLVTVLRDWAVESGAAATAAQLAQAAATTASAYLAQTPEEETDDESVEAVAVAGTLRCADCPVCRTLDALDETNPQLADSARLVLAQLGGMIAGLLDSTEPPDRSG